MLNILVALSARAICRPILEPSISARKSTCKPGRFKHKRKSKKKKRFPSFYAYACACVVRVNQPLLRISEVIKL